MKQLTVLIILLFLGGSIFAQEISSSLLTNGNLNIKDASISFFVLKQTPVRVGIGSITLNSISSETSLIDFKNSGNLKNGNHFSFFRTKNENQITESLNANTDGMKPKEYATFVSISNGVAPDRENKITDLKEKTITPEKKPHLKQTIGACDIGACDIESSNTGFWVFLTAVSFAVGAFLGKGN